MEGKNGERFVTYRGMFVAVIAIMGLVIGYVYYSQDKFEKAIEKLDTEKVDVCIYEERTKRIIEDLRELKGITLENRILNEQLLRRVEKLGNNK